MSPSLDEALRHIVREVVREELRSLPPVTPQRGRPTGAPSTSGCDGEFISTARAAQIAGVHEATIRDWVRRQLLKEHRAGRLLRVDPVELRAFLSRPKNASNETIDLDALAEEILGAAARREPRRSVRKGK